MKKAWGQVGSGCGTMWYSVYFQLRDRNPEIHSLISIKQTKEQQQTPPNPQTNKQTKPPHRYFYTYSCLWQEYCSFFQDAVWMGWSTVLKLLRQRMEWGGILCVLGSNWKPSVTVQDRRCAVSLGWAALKRQGEEKWLFCALIGCKCLMRACSCSSEFKILMSWNLEVLNQQQNRGVSMVRQLVKHCFQVLPLSKSRNFLFSLKVSL